MAQPPIPPAPGPLVPELLQPVPPVADRLRGIALTSLWLGIAEIAYCLYKLLAQIFMPVLWSPGRGRIVYYTPEMQAAAQAYTARIAPWEMLRTAPFVIATGFLLWIALRLRAGDVSALRAARLWGVLAFIPIGISVVIQSVITVPAAVVYERAVVASIPPLPGGAPFDVQKTMGTFMTASALAGLFVTNLALCVWPIVVHYWARRLDHRIRTGTVR
jgi:hypothetical protein